WGSGIPISGRSRIRTFFSRRSGLRAVADPGPKSGLHARDLYDHDYVAKFLWPRNCGDHIPHVLRETAPPSIHASSHPLALVDEVLASFDQTNPFEQAPGLRGHPTHEVDPGAEFGNHDCGPPVGIHAVVHGAVPGNGERFGHRLPVRSHTIDAC